MMVAAVVMVVVPVVMVVMVVVMVVVGENTTQKLHVHRLGHIHRWSPNTVPNHL
jgi:hypothetical protein